MSEIINLQISVYVDFHSNIDEFNTERFVFYDVEMTLIDHKLFKGYFFKSVNHCNGLPRKPALLFIVHLANWTKYVSFTSESSSFARFIHRDFREQISVTMK